MNCWMATVTFMYLILMLFICIPASFFYLYAVVKDGVELTGFQIFAFIWCVFAMFQYLTCLLMVTQYDSVFKFINTNCGNANNDQRCCPINLDVCCCCNKWKEVSMRASLSFKLAFIVFTGISSLGLYIIAYKEDTWNLPGSMKVFLALEFYGFVVYNACLGLMWQCCAPEDERAEYHIARSNSSVGVVDRIGLRTAALNAGMFGDQEEPKLFLDEMWVAERVYKFSVVEEIVVRNQGSVDNCPICLESYHGDQEVLLLECRHIFHKPCSMKWFDKHSHCPMCRAKQDN